MYIPLFIPDFPGRTDKRWKMGEKNTISLTGNGLHDSRTHYESAYVFQITQYNMYFTYMQVTLNVRTVNDGEWNSSLSVASLHHL